MAQPTPARVQICPGCDGFASAEVTRGGRDHRGHLRTVTVHCTACQGTGTRSVRSAGYATFTLVSVGR
ncbi:hypothetical protein [Streptomyces longispororuber]|uniref:hypothetical protein n=1 Tax=Streptomyces longispororuber TaxID=68230 RepID=UPI0021095785|nr:hypothetical protein [Streptomyces longispororuber]MCQ4214472.1 hypothetical protein [Streptomyces longispororuber]